MADSEDEDIKRAIEMSLEDQHSTHPIVDLTESEDEDMRQAIALSLQHSEQEASPVPSIKQPLVPSTIPATQNIKPVSQNAFFSSGIDRKAMEAERLARLNKRKRSPSPKRPSKMAVKAVAAVSTPLESQETHSSIQYPRGSIKRTFAAGHKRTDDVKIEDVLQASTLKIAVIGAFDLDAHWLFTKLDRLKTKQLWIGSHKDRATQDQWMEEAKQNAIKMHFPPMNGQIQINHSKLLLLIHETHMRIAIPTANMNRSDWGETLPYSNGQTSRGAVLENSVFFIDLPRRKDQGSTEESALSFFGKELLRFLEAQKVAQHVLDGVLKFDYSETHHLAFVHSIGGVHANQVRERTGLPGLSRALRVLKMDDVVQLELDYASASLGGLKKPFLQHLYTAAMGHTTSQFHKIPSDFTKRIRIYYPTHESVMKSVGGPDSGGTIMLNASHYNADLFPKQCMREYISNRPRVLSHNKILLARGLRGTDNKPFAWAYVGSANLSESAWGMQKTPKPGETVDKLSIRNWECGVLVPVPDGAFAQLKLADGEVPPIDVFKGTIEIPFEWPGKTFDGKKPWL
ncbi:tyrosyl-DNA phosphodiesterase domain-containing protein, partial [Polyplosphaeria fusca]